MSAWSFREGYRKGLEDGRHLYAYAPDLFAPWDDGSGMREAFLAGYAAGYAAAQEWETVGL